MNDAISKINANFRDIDLYSKKLLSKYLNNNKFLLVTENHAEGNFIDLDKEIEMYAWIIRKYCPKNSVIFIKSHPLETLPRNQLIKRKLQEEYKIIALDTNYIKYPIELWRALIEACGVICMSYPVLSLKYLYNKDVIQPMNKDFIDRWFKKDYQKSYNMALELYLKPMERLKTWDGKSVLFTKKRSFFI